MATGKGALPERGTLIYEGKAKQVFTTSDPDRVVVLFKDSATAFDGAKKAEITDKGAINAGISAFLMVRMEEAGIATHFEASLSEREHLCKKVEIVPIEVVVRNVLAGSICKRFGLEEGGVIARPLVEFFYKSDPLHDPPCSDAHCELFGWAQPWELAYMRHAALEVNRVLQDFWSGLGITLVDFKIEFGRYGKGQLLLADEITPDGSRLWDTKTKKKLDKDVFRRDLGDLSDTYRELYARVFGHGVGAAVGDRS
jgi:phosphoribosylaminoimidazole-succinocarboxamide synthase